jgi:hypothetical protein
MIGRIQFEPNGKLATPGRRRLPYGSTSTIYVNGFTQEMRDPKN